MPAEPQTTPAPQNPREPAPPHGLQAQGIHLPSRTRKHETAAAKTLQHVTETRGYVAWSGGRDSTVALHLALRADPLIPVTWFDSGLEYPETHTYIEHLVRKWNINFHRIPANPDALTLLKRDGSWSHGTANATQGKPDLHTALIAEPSRQAHERFGPGEIVGLRATESAGRRILLASGNGHYTRTDGTTVCAPIWRWTDEDVASYLDFHSIPENPVYAKLRALGAPPYAQRVGLIVDANGAEHGRFSWLRTGWPALWADLAEALPRLREWR